MLNPPLSGRGSLSPNPRGRGLLHGQRGASTTTEYEGYLDGTFSMAAQKLQEAERVVDC